MQYYIEYEVCAFFFLAVMSIFYFRKETFFTQTSRIFSMLMSWVLLALLIDIIGAFTISFSSMIPLETNSMINMLVFFFQGGQAVIYFFFAMALTNHLTRKNAKSIVLLLVPAVVMLLMIAATPVHGTLFYFDETLGYHRGHLFLLYYVCAFFYLSGGLYFIQRYRKKISKLQYASVLSYVVLVLTAVVLQILFPKYLITGTAVVFALMMSYFSFQNPDDFMDKLTGLYGRSAFLLTLEKRMKKESYELIVIDIKHFKMINTIFGYKNGDALIAAIGAFLSEWGRNDEVFRLHGAQFAIMKQQEIYPVGAAIQRRFREEWAIGGTEILLDVDMIIMKINERAKTLEDIVNYVEASLEIVNRYDDLMLTVDSTIYDTINERQLIEKILRQIVAGEVGVERLKIFFDPIYCRKRNRFIEANAFFSLEIGGRSVEQNELIRIAEKAGIVHPFSIIVFDYVCRFLAETGLHENGLDCVAIRISITSVMNQRFVRNSVEKIDRYGLPHNFFRFGVTEKIVSQCPEELLLLMEELVDWGFSFSLEDYGRGLFNSDTIIKFPFGAIVLDEAILLNCEKYERAVPILDYTVKNMKDLGLKVIAQGADDIRRVELLEGAGVDFYKGDFYGGRCTSSAFLEKIERIRGT